MMHLPALFKRRMQIIQRHMIVALWTCVRMCMAPLTRSCESDMVWLGVMSGGEVAVRSIAGVPQCR